MCILWDLTIFNNCTAFFVVMLPFLFSMLFFILIFIFTFNESMFVNLLPLNLNFYSVEQ